MGSTRRMCRVESSQVEFELNATAMSRDETMYTTLVPTVERGVTNYR